MTLRHALPQDPSWLPPTGAEIYGRYDVDDLVTSEAGLEMTEGEVRERRYRFPSLNHVYFVAAPLAGLIKIGYSENVEQRLLALKAGSPCELVPLGIIHGDRSYEKALFSAFRCLRAHSEWFRAEPALVEYIERYAVPWPTRGEPRRAVPEGQLDRRFDEWLDALEVWEYLKISVPRRAAGEIVEPPDPRCALTGSTPAV